MIRGCARMSHTVLWAVHVGGIEGYVALGLAAALFPDCLWLAVGMWLAMVLGLVDSAWKKRLGVPLTRLMFWLGEVVSSGHHERWHIKEVARDDEEAMQVLVAAARSPFVVRGWQQSPATLDEMAAATSASILVHSYDKHGSRTMTLAELRDMIAEGSTANAKSVHEIFQGDRGHALLARCVDRERIDSMRGTQGRPWGPLAALAFVGGKGTLSRCHADPFANLYLQLEGTKRWFLAPPSAVSALYVLPRANVAYISIVGDRDANRHKQFPAYDRCDKGVVDLGPGDLLFIPPFWFHEVRNLCTAVGLAMCWLDGRLRMPSIMALGSMSSWRFLQRWLKPESHPVDDELMRSCRRLPHTPEHPLRTKKTASRRLLPLVLVGTASALSSEPRRAPISVNYFPSRRCNMSCKFCFHTAKTSSVLPLDEAKRGLELLADAGMEKLNVAGGEPFLNPTFLGSILRFAKHTLGVSTSVISNGSLVAKTWLEKHANDVDIFGISCDSFDPSTNVALGRVAPGLSPDDHLAQVNRVADWCHQFEVSFKLNTVVTSLNHREDMNNHIAVLDPFRWKVFQCLVLEGENAGLNDDLRDATDLVIPDAHFTAFLDRHSAQLALVPESNDEMQASYLLLDEHMRWLDCSRGAKVPRPVSILDDPSEVYDHAGFDYDMFLQRGGVYKWARK